MDSQREFVSPCVRLGWARAVGPRCRRRQRHHPGPVRVTASRRGYTRGRVEDGRDVLGEVVRGAAQGGVGKPALPPAAAAAGCSGRKRPQDRRSGCDRRRRGAKMHREPFQGRKRQRTPMQPNGQQSTREKAATFKEQLRGHCDVSRTDSRCQISGRAAHRAPSRNPL